MVIRTWLAIVVPIFPLLAPLWAQSDSAWRDTSPHTVQFVTVENNVRLEVLDWGGSGRPIVLLAGMGNTAHVFDEFAPKLTSDFHVYGITRRGFGASSVPEFGYDADRLGEDVLAVIDSLHLSTPVLAGHSVAGQELSSLGSRHPERISGLIYLDAAYPYAYAAPQTELWRKLNELQSCLKDLQKHAASTNPRDNPKKLVQDLLQTRLPPFQKELEEFERFLPGEGLPTLLDFPSPSAADLESFQAFRSWYTRYRGFTPPEAELRQTSESTADGRVGEPRTPGRVPAAIRSGARKYTAIRVPALAIFAVPHIQGPWLNMADPAIRTAAERYYIADAASTEAQAMAFEHGVANARVVKLARANHYVFMSNEADVLRELRTFVAGLP